MSMDDDKWAKRLFLEARTHNGWREEKISDDKLKELFALTTTRYLTEIKTLLDAVDEQTDDARERLRRGFEAFADYGIEHPAFLDCALSLLRQPAGDLRAQVSDAVWLRLGRTIGTCTGWLADWRISRIRDPM